MINNRIIFVLMPLFLALIISISSAPIQNTQLIATNLETTTNSVTYDDDDDNVSIESDEFFNETSTIVTLETTTVDDLETTTDNVFIKDTTTVPFDIDEIIRISNQIFAGIYEPLATTSENP